MKIKILKKLSMFICLLVCASLLSGCCLGTIWLLSRTKETSETSETADILDIPDESEINEESFSEFGNEKEITIGDLKADDYVLSIEENTISAGKEVQIEVLNAEEKAKLENSEKYKLLGEPLKFSLDAEEAGFFAGDVKYSVPVPKEILKDPTKLNSLVFVYYDDVRDEVRYMFPDEYDEETKTFSIYLPHFSFWGRAKLTDEEKIEAFLDKYCMDEAIRRSDLQQAASALEPYLEAKLKNLKMVEEAKKEVIWGCINVFVGYYAKKPGEELADRIADQEYLYDKTFREVSSPKDVKHLKSLLGTTSEAATRAGMGIYRSVNENDSDKFRDQMETIIAQNYLSHIIRNLDENNPSKKYFGPIGDVVGHASSLGAAAGHMTEGHYKEGFEALIPVAESIIQKSNPKVALAVQAMKYVEAKSRQSLTNWKSNQVEELYQLYKKGGKGFFNNEVEAQDEKSFLAYLDYGSGFVKGRAIKRFYKMDKVAETCEMYGWDPMEYNELPKEYRETFDERAREGLLGYFRTRLAQELEAERIKEDERVCIETMLEGAGCLVSYRHMEFFGEKGWGDYDVNNRLQRLMNIRNNISHFVDLEKLEKDKEYWKKRGEPYYNFGDILNLWVDCMSENMKDKEAGIRKFKEGLKARGYLHPDYMVSLYPTLDQLVGVYEGQIIHDGVTISELWYLDWWPDKQDEIIKDTAEWNKHYKGKAFHSKNIEIEKIDDTHGRLITNILGDGYYDFEYSDNEGIIAGSIEAMKTNPVDHNDLLISKFNIQASYTESHDKIILKGTHLFIDGRSGVMGYDGSNYSFLEKHKVKYEKKHKR
ncbi:MAG: hypothetical protein ACOX75_08125 [Lachnospiraceae bacterium]|jgi:hypothetical protein